MYDENRGGREERKGFGSLRPVSRHIFLISQEETHRIAIVIVLPSIGALLFDLFLLATRYI